MTIHLQIDRCVLNGVWLDADATEVRAEIETCLGELLRERGLPERGLVSRATESARTSMSLPADQGADVLATAIATAVYEALLQ